MAEELAVSRLREGYTVPNVKEMIVPWQNTCRTFPNIEGAAYYHNDAASKSQMQLSLLDKMTEDTPQLTPEERPITLQ